MLTARRSGRFAIPVVLRAHGLGAGRRSSPRRCQIRVGAGSAPAPRAPRQPLANFPAATLRGGGGRGGGGGGGAGAARGSPPAPPPSCRASGSDCGPGSPCPQTPPRAPVPDSCLADSYPAGPSPRTPPRRTPNPELTRQTPARANRAGRRQLPAGTAAVDGQVRCVAGARPGVGAVTPRPFLSSPPRSRALTASFPGTDCRKD